MKRYSANIIGLFFTAIVILSSSVSSQAQTKKTNHALWNWKKHKTETISYAKKYLVSDIEPNLPRQSFAKWFRELVGIEAKLAWKIVDCGFETGDGGPRDKTMCVVADAALGSDFWVSVYIQVGTFKDGIMPGKPIIRYARVSREDEPWESTTKLAALPNVFDSMMSK